MRLKGDEKGCLIQTVASQRETSTPKGRRTTVWPICSEKCMKMKKFWSKIGASLAPSPQIHQCQRWREAKFGYFYPSKCKHFARGGHLGSSFTLPLLVMSPHTKTCSFCIGTFFGQIDFPWIHLWVSFLLASWRPVLYHTCVHLNVVLTQTSRTDFEGDEYSDDADDDDDDSGDHDEHPRVVVPAWLWNQNKNIKQIYFTNDVIQDFP